ncbi:hypothetical protein WNY37_10855 [Henriciella sp. AS95]|uniref:hypothetical protein n=1 Tax=Henriciella sp. AS95 TaxID=3135782 RepID=UPI0031789F81
MDLTRNIITAIWCAVIIGTNVFGLIVLSQVVGMNALLSPGLLLPVVKMALMAGFGLLALVSTKYLWFVLAVAVMALLLGLTYDIFIQRMWRSSGMLGALATIIPTYLLARWNTAARKTNFNPVKEF